MFKFLVLSALLGIAAAEPGVFIAPLATTYGAAVSTLPAAYVQHGNYFSAPAVYSGIAYPHLIKKRSPQSDSYAPLAVQSKSKYVSPAPSTPKKPVMQTTYASSEHYTQKRSAPIFDASTAYVAPALASTYVASAPLGLSYPAILPSSYYSGYNSYISALPFIKK